MFAEDIAIDRALRHSHRMRLAAKAAWNAAQIVQRCALAEGIELPDADVTHVARAAAEVAAGGRVRPPRTAPTGNPVAQISIRKTAQRNALMTMANLIGNDDV